MWLMLPVIDMWKKIGMPHLQKCFIYILYRKEEAKKTHDFDRNYKSKNHKSLFMTRNCLIVISQFGNYSKALKYLNQIFKIKTFAIFFAIKRQLRDIYKFLFIGQRRLFPPTTKIFTFASFYYRFSRYFSFHLSLLNSCFT